jgi:flagellar FliL protein
MREKLAMASNQEAPEGKDDGSAAAEGEAPKGLKKFLTRKKLLIIVPALLVVLGGAGGGAYFMMGSHPKEGEEAAEAPVTPPKVAFSDMADILVNIQSADGAAPAYLKLSVSLELDDEEHKAAIQPLMPRITDQFQAYLRELRLDDLKGSAGVLRLKEELLRRVNVAAAPYHVRDVLLKEMIVQ